MKTTIDISDSLMREARKVAAHEETTVRALVEEGLRRVLAGRSASKPFRLRDASFGGKGLQPGAENASWERIREMAYEGRGG